MKPRAFIPRKDKVHKYQPGTLSQRQKSVRSQQSQQLSSKRTLRPRTSTPSISPLYLSQEYTGKQPTRKNQQEPCTDKKRQDNQPACCIEAWAFPSHHLCLLPRPTCTTASWPRGATMPTRNAIRPCYPRCHQMRYWTLSSARCAHYCISFLSYSTHVSADGMLSAAHHRCNGSVVTIRHLH